MPEVVLKINEKSFRLAFGLELFRILGRKWNLPGINEVVAKIAILDGVSSNLTFEAMDILEQIIITAIEIGEGTDVDLSGIKVLDEFFKNPNALEAFKNSLIESLPQNKPQNNEGKPKARNSKKA